MIPATPAARTANDVVWDVIVIGAGPAGATAAIRLARAGLRVLLTDRSEFPRPKLCGGCLNGASLALLREIGFSETLDTVDAIPLQDFHLAFETRQTTLNLKTGMAVCRSRFDAMLVQAAIEAGAEFLPGRAWQLDPADDSAQPFRSVTSNAPPGKTLQARVLVVATGLSNAFLSKEQSLEVVESKESRIGIGTTIPADDGYGPGTIFMAVGRDGYVGLTRTSGASLNIAAAVKPELVRSLGPAQTCESIIRDVGLPPVPGLAEGRWQGTAGLTRHRRRTATARVFVIGDAAGYVEPFTGEGMAWAMQDAEAVVPFVLRGAEHWTDALVEEWSSELKRRLRRRQRWCRAFSFVLRSPWAVRTIARGLSYVPALGRAVVRRIHQEPSA